MVSGIVEPTNRNNELASHYRGGDYKGVVRVFEIREHGTKINHNMSSDTTRLVTRVVEDVPFNLVDIDNRFKINVHKPLDANFLLDELEISYHNFTPKEESIASKLLSLFTPVETIRGVETTEKMLKNGTHLTVFGKIEKVVSSYSTSLFNKSQSNYKISEPSMKDCSFIITKSSKDVLIDRLKSSIKVYKISLIIFGSFGLALGVYIAYKKIKEYIAKTEYDRMMEQARQQRIENQRARTNNNNINNNNNNNGRVEQNIGSQNNEPSSSEQNTCIICLTNPRELVLIDCGHVCLCFECFERMPNTNCPICRKRYTSFVPCYLP